MPPYFSPTSSVKNRNNYFPQSEELGKDEMRITLMGSQPFPPRLDQAGTCIMVELGNGKRFSFDFGSGCMRNIIANQVPVPEINDIFITHLHVDHYAHLPYLRAFAPFNGRSKPLRVVGPSGRTPELGTKAMCEHLRKMGAWHEQAFSGCAPLQDGYEIEVAEFDFKEDGGVCYDKNDGKMPTALPKLKYTVEGNQEQSVRDLEIQPEVFTPKDQIRTWVREWPENLRPAVLFGGSPQKE